MFAIEQYGDFVKPFSRTSSSLYCLSMHIFKVWILRNENFGAFVNFDLILMMWEFWNVCEFGGPHCGIYKF